MKLIGKIKFKEQLKISMMNTLKLNYKKSKKK